MKLKTKERVIHYTYFLYLLGYYLLLIGVNLISETYVLYLKNIIELIISILLIYKFSFMDSKKFNYFDKKIIIISAWLLLSNTIFMAIIRLHGSKLLAFIKNKIL
jgi:hypothetical protein